MRRVTAATLVGCAVACLATVKSQGATGCAATTETRNTWHRLHTPVDGAHVAMDDADACTTFAAADDGRTWVTADGGLRWSRRGDVGVPVRALVRGGLPNDVVVAVPRGTGLRVTRDAGRTWSAAAGLSDVTVDAVAVDPEDRTSLWAVGTQGMGPATAPTGSVYSSTDGGRTWTENAGGLALRPATIAAIGAPYRAVFAADPRTQQLWRRNDSDAFTPVYADDVRALAVSPLKGGGSQLFAAGPAGVAVTKDGGATFRALTTLPATAVATEYQHFTAFLFVTDGRVRRSTNAGRTTRPVGDGLPAVCRPSSLTANRGDPSTFLAVCTDGSTWRWRSDGSDLSDTDSTDGGTTPPIAVLPNATPMQVLKHLRLPGGHDESAAIAFDGTYLYYTLHGEKGRVHRVVTATGRPARDVVFHGIDAAIIAITYDSARHVLYLADAKARTWAVALRTMKVRHLFDGPYDASCCGTQPWGSLSYDASIDQFVFIDDASNVIYWHDPVTGQETRHCTASSIQLGPETGETGFAAIAASGDGDLYAGSEDDSTVYRIDSGCHVTAAYSHPYLSEASDENDAMACDTVTFGQAAIWMRNADAGIAYAYAVPDGYCALATRLSVTAPATVSTGAAGPVCARLVRTGTGAAIRGVPVQLFVADRPIGTARTDSAGRACLAYQPTASEAGRGSSASRSVTTRSRLRVVGTFLGTIAYRPASAQARLVAVDPASPLATPAPPATHLGTQLTVAAPPAAVAPPPPPAPPAAQVQPLPQAHPGAQPGAQAMGQPGAAAQQEEEAQAATAQVRGDEFHARAPVPLPDLRIVLATSGLLAGVVARRRRASHVRGQRA
jgi:hypothetical protein